MSAPPSTTARSPLRVTDTRWPVIALIFGLFVLVATLAANGLLTPRQLADPGTLVRWGLPLVTYLMDGAAIVTVGTHALAAFALRDPFRSESRRVAAATEGDKSVWMTLRRVGLIAAVAWGIFHIIHLVFTHSSVVGAGLGEPNTGESLMLFVTEIDQGTTLLVACVITAFLALVAAGAPSATGAAWVVALSMMALVPRSLVGHAAGAANHDLAVSGLWLHLGPITLWVGLLVAMCLVARRVTNLEAVATRVSSMLLWSAILVGASGVLSASLRVYEFSELFTHPYGRLVLAKAVGTAALIAAGWWHRRSTIPKIPSQSSAFKRLVGGEVVLMAAISALGVTMSISPPPVPDEPPPDASPTYFITGYPVPEYPESWVQYLTEWRIDPIWAVVVGAACIVYARWVAQLRKRSDVWPKWRTAMWYIGLVLFFYVTCGGLHVYGIVLFSAHMGLHMALSMLVPVFLVMGAPLTLALRALPTRRDGSRGPREWLLALLQSRYAQFFAKPSVAAVNFAGSLILFYFTPIFDLALQFHIGHILMVVHFTIVGYLFANVLVGIDPGPTRPAYPIRLLLLFATMAFHAFFGIAIISSTTLLGAGYYGWLGLPWGVDAMADQEFGGLITWGLGEIPTVALAIVVALMWTKSDEREARRTDRRADADDDAELRAYNEMLGRLADQDQQSRS